MWNVYNNLKNFKLENENQNKAKINLKKIIKLIESRKIKNFDRSAINLNEAIQLKPC